jgi:hypothetical protein
MRSLSRYVLPIAALSVALLVEGCVVAVPAPVEDPMPVVETPAAEVVELRTPLAFYAWARQAKTEELSAERKRLDSNADGEDAFMQALRSGLLMLASGAADGRREAIVLEALASDAAKQQPDENRALGSLVSTQLRLRRQVSGSTRQSATSNAEMERLRSENSRLQQQIDALTSIEQQLIERELQDPTSNGQP